MNTTGFEDVISNNADFGGVNAIWSIGGLTVTGSQFFAFNDFPTVCQPVLERNSALRRFQRQRHHDLAIRYGCDIDVVLGEGVFGTFRCRSSHRSQRVGSQADHNRETELSQDTAGIFGTSQTGDAFGFALTGMGGLRPPAWDPSWQDVVHTCDGNRNHRRCRLQGHFVVSNPSTQSVRLRSSASICPRIRFSIQVICC